MGDNFVKIVFASRLKRDLHLKEGREQIISF